MFFGGKRPSPCSESLKYFGVDENKNITPGPKCMLFKFPFRKRVAKMKHVKHDASGTLLHSLV